MTMATCKREVPCPLWPMKKSLEPKHFTCDHNLVVVGHDRVIKGGYWEKSIPRSFISSCCRAGSSTIAFSLREGHTKA
jgi:hypothetical protein